MPLCGRTAREPRLRAGGTILRNRRRLRRRTPLPRRTALRGPNVCSGKTRPFLRLRRRLPPRRVPLRHLSERVHMRWRVLWTLLLGAGFGCRNAPPGEGGIEPWVDQEQDLAQIGYDQTFHIDLRKAPPPARHGQIQWAQVAGPLLRDIATSEQGFYFSARMPALRELVPEGLAWGIVPVSPRTRCEVVLEAEWRSSSGSSPQRRRFPIAAAARSRG